LVALGVCFAERDQNTWIFDPFAKTVNRVFLYLDMARSPLLVSIVIVALGHTGLRLMSNNTVYHPLPVLCPVH